MDYISTNLCFKIKKTLRYIRLYGLQRTLVKINGQRHMHKVYESRPAPCTRENRSAHVGLIGCGNFAYTAIAYYLVKNFGRVMRGAMDVDINKAASLFEKYRLHYYTDDPDKVISDPAIDLVFVASNHASHAEYAVLALSQGKSVHIEKPHVVNEDQLQRLCQAMANSKGKVALGFNRPHSRIFQKIKRTVDSQTGPLMMNWFVVGHEIPPDHWYFKEDEGGRVLGNLCHWIDFIYQLVPEDRRYPITISPTGGDNSDCDIAMTYLFGDGSIAVITFTAKGHTFEGVRERFAAQRGNVLIFMNDFKNLRVEIVDKSERTRLLFRDHGHEANIRRSYEMVRPQPGIASPSSAVKYVWETGELFLKTREALESRKQLTVYRFEDSPKLKLIENR